MECGCLVYFKPRRAAAFTVDPRAVRRMRIFFIPGDVRIADRFPTAGTSYKGGCAPSPAPEPHWSCENCAVEFLPATLLSQKLQFARPAFQKVPLMYLRLHLPAHHSRWAKSFLHLQRSPVLLPPTTPTALPHCGAREHFPANHSAAIPRSRRR